LILQLSAILYLVVSIVRELAALVPQPLSVEPKG